MELQYWGRRTWRMESGTQFFLSSALRLIVVKRGRSWSTSDGTLLSVVSPAASSAMPIFGAFYSWISQFAGFLGKPLYLRDNSSVCPTGLAFPDKLQLFRDGIILSCPERFQVTIGLVRKPGAICPAKVRTVLPTAWEHTLGCLPLSHYFWYQHFWQLIVLLEHTVFVPVDQWAGLAV